MMRRVSDASSSPVLVLTSGVFPECALQLRSRPPSRTPSWSSSALRRSRQVQRHHSFRSACASLPSHRAYLTRLRGAPGVSRPLDASFRNLLLRPCFVPVPSLGFSSLRRFLPARSPGSLSARSVLLVVTALARSRLRGFQHRSDAWCRAMVSGVDTRSSPGCCVPSRYRPCRPRSALPRRSSPGLLWTDRPCGLSFRIVLFRVSENRHGGFGSACA